MWRPRPKFKVSFYLYFCCFWINITQINFENIKRKLQRIISDSCFQLKSRFNVDASAPSIPLLNFPFKEKVKWQFTENQGKLSSMESLIWCHSLITTLHTNREFKGLHVSLWKRIAHTRKKYKKITIDICMYWYWSTIGCQNIQLSCIFCLSIQWILKLRFIPLAALKCIPNQGCSYGVGRGGGGVVPP